MPSLRKRTQEREVKRHKRAARKKLDAQAMRAPGLGQNTRDKRNLLIATFATWAAICAAPSTVMLYLIPAYCVLIAGQWALTRAFKQGGDYVSAMHLRAELSMMDAVCEAAEEQLAPHHPERVAAHDHRAMVRKELEQAVSEYR